MSTIYCAGGIAGHICPFFRYIGPLCASKMGKSVLTLPLGSLRSLKSDRLLETAVGRARWCVGSRGCREATTPQAGACKEARQRQVREPAYQRVRSALTQQVKTRQGRKASFHAVFARVERGQLRFLGLWQKLPSVGVDSPRRFGLGGAKADATAVVVPCLLPLRRNALRLSRRAVVEARPRPDCRDVSTAQSRRGRRSYRGGALDRRCGARSRVIARL